MPHPPKMCHEIPRRRILNNMNNKNEEIRFYKERTLKNIYRLMSQNNWTLRQLADNSLLPYESVKKLMSGKISNPSIYTLMKISHAFGCGIDYILETESTYGITSPKLPLRAFTLIQEIANLEIYLKEYNDRRGADEITVIVPTGIIHDGMVFDSIYTETIDISAYREDFNDIIMCGLKNVGKELSPTYLDGDVLLIARDRFPLNGEIGVFLIGSKAYIRKYTLSSSIIMEPVNGIGTPIKIHNIDEVHFFGRVLTVIRR